MLVKNTNRKCFVTDPLLRLHLRLNSITKLWTSIRIYWRIVKKHHPYAMLNFHPSWRIAFFEESSMTSRVNKPWHCVFGHWDPIDRLVTDTHGINIFDVHADEKQLPFIVNTQIDIHLKTKAKEDMILKKKTICEQSNEGIE